MIYTKSFDRRFRLLKLLQLRDEIESPSYENTLVLRLDLELGSAVAEVVKTFVAFTIGFETLDKFRYPKIKSG